jgi:hypothetical protein
VNGAKSFSRDEYVHVDGRAEISMPDKRHAADNRVRNADEVECGGQLAQRLMNGIIAHEKPVRRLDRRGPARRRTWSS